MEDRVSWPSRRQRYMAIDTMNSANLETAVAGTLAGTLGGYDISLPSRRQRRKDESDQLYHEITAGLIFFLIGLFILMNDFSHLDRHWLPVVSIVAALCYASVIVWWAVGIVKEIELPQVSVEFGVFRLPRYDGVGSLLINRPHLKGFMRLLSETAISLSAWLVFLYFFQPLSTALLWMITGEWLWWYIFSVEAVYGTLDMLFNAVIFAAVILLGFSGWAQWNLYHYGGLDRRKPPLPIKDEQVAEHFGVTLETVKTAQKARLATINPTVEGPVFTVKSKV